MARFLQAFPKPDFNPVNADVFAPGKKPTTIDVSSIEVSEDVYTVFAPGGKKAVSVENSQTDNAGDAEVSTTTLVFAPGTQSVYVSSYSEATGESGNNEAIASATVFAPGSQSGEYGVQVEVEAVIGGDGVDGNDDLAPSTATAEGYLFAAGSQYGTDQDGVQLDVESTVPDGEDTDFSQLTSTGMLFAPGSQSGDDDGIDFEVTSDAGEEEGTTVTSYGSMFIPGTQEGGDEGVEIDVGADDTADDGLARVEFDLFATGNGDEVEVQLEAGEGDDSGAIEFSYFGSGQRELDISTDAYGGNVVEVEAIGLSGDWFQPSENLFG